MTRARSHSRTILVVTTCAVAATTGGFASLAAAPSTIGAGAQAGAGAVRLHPPAPVGGAPTFGGCQVLPSDHPFNTSVTTLGVRPESAGVIAATSSIGGRATLQFQFWSKPTSGFQPIAVPMSQPLVPIVYDQHPEFSDPGPFPIPLDVPREDNADGHVLVVQQGFCHLYELGALHRLGAGWASAVGADWNLSSNATRPLGWTSADAAGLPILPGLLRYDEVASGHIDHVLRMTVALMHGAYVLPATSPYASSTSAAYFPNGARLRLRADFDTSQFSGQSKVIVEALKTYGLIVADQGPNWMISGVGDSRWDDADMNQIRNIPASALEYVDTGPVHG